MNNKISTLYAAHENMSPDDALKAAMSQDYDDVIILGYNNEGDLCVTSSKTNRANALWMVEKAKQQILE